MGNREEQRYVQIGDHEPGDARQDDPGVAASRVAEREYHRGREPDWGDHKCEDRDEHDDTDTPP